MGGIGDEEEGEREGRGGNGIISFIYNKNRPKNIRTVVIASNVKVGRRNSP